jgi:hypothetical protein
VKPRLELCKPSCPEVCWRLRNEAGELTAVYFERLQDALAFLYLYADRATREKFLNEVRRCYMGPFVYRMNLLEGGSPSIGKQEMRKSTEAFWRGFEGETEDGEPPAGAIQ